MTKERYSIAFSEISYIINNMSIENREKISEDFIQLIENNKNKEYIPENISLNDTDSLKRETKILIAIMYRDFFMSQEEKLKKEEEDQKALEKMYSYENMFENVKKVNKQEDEVENLKEEKQEEVSMVEIKKNNFLLNFFNNIKNKIKEMIRK